MSKTYKDAVSLFDTSKTKKRRGEASARFKHEKQRKSDERLFKREVNFTNYIIETSKED